MTEVKKYKCPKCGNMNEKENAVFIGRRYFCEGCVGENQEDEKEVETKTEVKQEEQPKVRKIKQFEQHEEVLVTSLVKRGTLIYVDQEGVVYEWQNFKDENYMSIKALRNMKNRHKKFFSEPWVRVDDDVAEFLKIKVDSTVDLENVDALFNLSTEEFEEKLLKASNGARNIIVDSAISKLETEELDSRQKVRIIEQICKVELEEQSYREFSEEVK